MGEEGDQGRCKRRSEVFVKSQNKIYFFFWGGVGSRVGGQGSYERKSEVFVKVKKNGGGGSGRGGGGVMWGGGGGVRMAVNEELKIL